MLTFKDESQLINWLNINNIDTTRWNHDRSGSVRTLWNEIIRGESQIEIDPPRRIVRAVSILIRRDDKILIEAQQVFDSGHYRYRGFPPTETMRSGESYVDATIRGLYEELHVEESQLKIISCSDTPKMVVNESHSYPGLITKYILNQVEVIIDNLPAEEFWTHEFTDDFGEPSITHHWQWVTENKEERIDLVIDTQVNKDTP